MTTRPTRCPVLSILVACCALVLLCACSDRPAIAARATVETFYTAIQADDLPVVQDNLAASASPRFGQRVLQAAAAAQTGGAAEKAVQLVQVGTPSIAGNTARVHVVFADGSSDTVSLVREGERWKVESTGKLS
jgi:hypothetical protein